MHITPDLKVYVGIMKDSRGERWKNESSYRNNGKFSDAIGDWNWDEMNHQIVESGLPKQVAINMRNELIRTAGQQSLNTRGYTDPNEKDFVLNTEIPNKKTKNMKKVKKESRRFRTISGVKSELMIDTRYRKNDGRYAVVIRVYNNGKYAYLQTGYNMTPDEFVGMETTTERALNVKRDIVLEYIEDMTLKGRFDINSVKAYLEPKLSGNVVEHKTLVGLLEQKAGMLTNSNTIDNYRTVIRRVLDTYPDGLALNAVSTATIGGFMNKLKADGLSDTTRNIYGTILKSTINYGIYKGVIGSDQYPFKRSPVEVDKIAIPKSASRDMEYLTKEQMQQIWEWFKAHKNRNIGYFLFSYLHGGINLADIITLKFGELYEQEKAFTYRRRKTINKNNFDIIVPATKWTDELLSIMGITPKKGELVFKEMEYDGSERGFQMVKNRFRTTVNRAVENVTRKLGMREASMTTARHTFCTVANKQRMPYSMIEKAMGHANNGVSGHYIGGFTPDEMRPDFERLL